MLAVISCSLAHWWQWCKRTQKDVLFGISLTVGNQRSVVCFHQDRGQGDRERSEGKSLPLSPPVLLGFWLNIPTVFWLGYGTFCFDVGRVLQRPTETWMSLSRPYFTLGREPDVLRKSPVCGRLASALLPDYMAEWAAASTDTWPEGPGFATCPSNLAFYGFTLVFLSRECAPLSFSVWERSYDTCGFTCLLEDFTLSEHNHRERCSIFFCSPHSSVQLDKSTVLWFLQGEPATHSYLCQVSDSTSSQLMAPPSETDLFPLPCRHGNGTKHRV